jgi:plastocyanin
MRLKVGAGSALLITLALAGAVAAQSPSESPAGSPGASAEPGIGDISGVPHPAHIHTGTCTNLGDVVAPLKDVTLVDGSDRVSVSTTNVDMSIKDMLESPHAIMSHASAENIGVYIACADLKGDDSAKRLVVALDDQNESGFYGAAFLQQQNGKTQVELTLTAPEPGAGGESPSGSPGATMAPMSMAPSSGEPGASAAAGGSVAIQDLAFQPNALTVPVGSTVTWTNNDSTQHTVTADDGSFDSGILQQGGTFSQTFATAGTFAYHCTIHDSMTGTITVQ